MRPSARRGAAMAGRFLFCWRRPSQPYSPRSHQTDRARWTHVERGRGQTGEGWIWRRQTWARRRRLLWRWERRAAPRPQQPRRRRRAEAWRVWVRGLGRIGGAGEDLGTPVCWGLRARARACLAEAYTRGSNLCFLCSWSRTSKGKREENCRMFLSRLPPLSPVSHCAFSLRLFPFPYRHAHTRHTKQAAAMPPRHGPDQVSLPCPVASGVSACVCSCAKGLVGWGWGAPYAIPHTRIGAHSTDAAPSTLQAPPIRQHRPAAFDDIPDDFLAYIPSLCQQTTRFFTVSTCRAFW
jgi:hypothetical protein